MKTYLAKHIALAAMAVTAYVSPATAQVIQHNIPGLEMFPLETSQFVSLQEFETIYDEVTDHASDQADEQLSIEFNLETCREQLEELLLEVDFVAEIWIQRYIAALGVMLRDLQNGRLFAGLDEQVMEAVTQQIQLDLNSLCPGNGRR